MIAYIKKERELFKSIIDLSLPAIGEMSMHTLLGVADTMMVSLILGSAALSATGFTNQIVFMLIFVFSSFNTGGTAMISRAFGEKDTQKMNTIAGVNISINTIIGIIVTLISVIFAKQIFMIFDMTKEVYGLALEYFNIIAYGMFFMFLNFCFSAIMRGAGDTKTPMVISAISNVINVIANYVLMTGFWIFPNLGIAGAALATSASRFIASLIYAKILFIDHYRIQVRLKNICFDSSILDSLWRISYPGAVENFLMQSSFVAVGVIVSYLDTRSEGAFRILLNIESLSFMPAVGISIASATLVGKSLGENNPDKALKTGYIASTISVAWGVFIALIFIIIPSIILRGFTADLELIRLSVFAMIIMALNQPFLNFMITLSGALRGAGDTMAVMTITSLRLWTMFVPLSYLFIITLEKGIAGIWIAEIISFIFFSAIMFTRFRSMKWAKIEL